MQEVFKRIIEKLEEYRDENLVEHDFEMANHCKQDCNGNDVSDCTLCVWDKAIEIVKQVSAEYNNGHFGCDTNGEHEKCNGCGLTDCKNRNKIWFGVGDDNNGWIPCSERLPEPIRPVLVTLRNWMNDKYIVRVGRFHTDHWKTDEGIVENSVVIAWQPLPQPYQTKGE